MPKIMKLRRIQLAIVGAVASLLMIGASPVPSSHAADRPLPVPRVLPKIEVNRATTYLTGPLNADGEVDYVAANEARNSAGATPENNFSVVLWQLMGPKQVNEDVRKLYFERLGIPVPPDDGEYYQTAFDFRQHNFEPASNLEILELEAIEIATTEPWTGKSHPWLIPWLRANEYRLDALARASRCSHRYDPYVSEDMSTGMMFILLPAENAAPKAVEGLRLRAMYQAGHNKIDAACDDLIAADRIGRRFAQGYTTVSILTGRRILKSTDIAIPVVLQLPGLKPEHVRRLRRERRSLPAPKGLLEIAGDDGDRILALDISQQLRRRGVKAWLDLMDATAERPSRAKKEGGKDEPAPRPNPFRLVFDKMLQNDVDWNDVMRDVNKEYDKLVEIARLSYAERRPKLEYLEYRTKSTRLADILNIDDFTPTAVNVLATQMVLYLNFEVVTRLDDTLTDSAARERLTDVALDLAEYRLLYRTYPDRLEQLAAIEGASSRVDPFTERELRYRRNGIGYVLYSLGPNQRDDDGRPAPRLLGSQSLITDFSKDKTAKTSDDDLVIRMPRVVKKP